MRKSKISEAASMLLKGNSDERSEAARLLSRAGRKGRAALRGTEVARSRASMGGLAVWKKHGPPLSPVDLIRDKEFLKVLDERERTIILERFSDKHQTLEQVATTLGLTRQRVHQLQNDALHKIAKAKADWKSRQTK